METTKTWTVGDGANVTYINDRQAGTIVRVLSPHCVIWQRDKATLTSTLDFGDDGFNGPVTGRQDYTFERDPDGEVITFTFRKNGYWVRKGDRQSTGQWLEEGRREYYDFNF